MLPAVTPNHALIEVYLARRRDLRAVASKILRHPDHIDDVLQDAYLKLADCVCARDIPNPFGYCCQVVRNLARDHCRRRMVESGYIVVAAADDFPELDGGRPADAGIDARRVLAKVDDALAALLPRTRLVFELHRIDGKTQREVGKIVGVSATLVNFMMRDVVHALAGCRELHE